ncbi:sulfatase-like hydrolase/transferase [Candidatus Poribacteria bacterium]|nr:sulfatase-like hydrolase/transferase [Candidatus Poribacteria bacterium]
MQALCKRVFVIGLDGAVGKSVREADTPNVDRIASQGVITYSGTSVYPSASFEAWGAMFHGVGPEKHKLNGENPISEDAPWPSFMKVIKQNQPDIICASFSCWGPINTHIIEKSCNCHCESMPDPDLTDAAVGYIRKSPPHVFFMQLDFIDGAGHSQGYGTEKYMKQISITDKLLGKVLDTVQDAGVFDESLFILLSDHGGKDTSHGGDNPESMNIFWACSGPGVNSGVELKNPVNIMDTGAVITYAFGLNRPKAWDGKIPQGIFINPIKDRSG